METIKRIFNFSRNAAAAALLVFALGCAAPALAARTSTETPIDALDEVSFDGATLKVAYSLQSRCKSAEHNAQIELSPQKSAKTITGININVFDITDEAECTGRKTTVIVNKTFNLAKIVDQSISDYARKGYKMDADYTINLPPMRPPVEDDGYSYNDDEDDDNSSNTGSQPAAPRKAIVTYIEYTPGWKCILRKNDGARKDGFTGTGSTLQEARSNAAQGCASTNHPSCGTFSNDPNHTTCDPYYETKETQKEFDANALPAGAALNNWSCTLKKNDGSKNDTFTGTASSESDARAQAANACKRTGSTKCDSFALDNSHTSCAAAYTLEGKKPVPMWACTLWKHDGARKDGFKGTGTTQQEALQGAIQGCASTNHPSCSVFATDPAHTTCDVEFVAQE